MITNDLGIVRFAELNDLPYVISLSKKESGSLGFIPKMAYESAITGIKTGDRWSNVCNDKLFIIVCNGDLVGFCLCSFGLPQANMRIGKIAQICIQTDARKLLRGKLLLDAVMEYGSKFFTFRWQCGCAEDLESNIFWNAMGWVNIADRQGISYKNTWKQTSKRKINIYRFDNMDMFITKDLIIYDQTTQAKKMQSM